MPMSSPRTQFLKAFTVRSIARPGPHRMRRTMGNTVVATASLFLEATATLWHSDLDRRFFDPAGVVEELVSRGTWHIIVIRSLALGCIADQRRHMTTVAKAIDQ